jgi:hypothetical protein
MSGIKLIQDWIVLPTMLFIERNVKAIFATLHCFKPAADIKMAPAKNILAGAIGLIRCFGLFVSFLTANLSQGRRL